MLQGASTHYGDFIALSPLALAQPKKTESLLFSDTKSSEKERFWLPSRLASLDYELWIQFTTHKEVVLTLDIDNVLASKLRGCWNNFRPFVLSKIYKFDSLNCSLKQIISLIGDLKTLFLIHISNGKVLGPYAFNANQKYYDTSKL